MNKTFMNKTSWIAVAVVVVIGGIVLLLFTGGSSPGSGRDPEGDVSVGPGGDAPDDPSVADLLASDVTIAEGEVTFEARVGADIPKEIPGGSLELRWDLSQGGAQSWIIQANVNVGLSAAITATQTDYGSSTVDETLPGDVKAEGDTITLTLNTDRLEGFPDTFQWRLTSTLDGAMADTDSAVATDALPDTGANDAS